MSKPARPFTTARWRQLGVVDLSVVDLNEGQNRKGSLKFSLHN
jgi:hypothetical protein